MAGGSVVRSTEGGGAIAVVLILLLALSGVAHGVLVLALRELRTVTATRHAWSATVAARGGLVRGFQRLDSLILLGEVPVDGLLTWLEVPEGQRHESRLRWLGPEYLFLEASGGSQGWPGKRSVGWVGWVLDPVTRVRSFGGMLETVQGLRVVNGTVPPLSPPAIPTGWPSELCEALLATFSDQMAPEGLPTWAYLPEGEASVESNPEIPGLGLLDGVALLSRAEEWARKEGEEGSPSPGMCPVSRGIDLIAATETFVVSEGTRCGLLLAAEDLVLRGDAVFQGLALVAGDLSVQGEARLEGMARVRGAVTLTDGETLRGSPCGALHVLLQLRELRRPVLLPEGHRIAGF
jgi:hypothetical protein